MLCAMVKADAYSHNAPIISKLIQNDVDYFGVANINEGIELRKRGIKKPVLCVGYSSFNDCIIASKYNIDITICNKQSFINALKTNKKLQVHIKIDTGMTRLGFKTIEEFEEVYELINKSKKMQLKGVFSHFVASENDKVLTEKQSKNFTKFISLVSDNDILTHISNSNGARNKAYNFGMVRVGIAMYGYGNITGLKPVLKIVAKVVDLHAINKGESVGYNGKYIANKKEIIATINIGYADGFDMRYSGFFVKINRKKYEIIGKICMDMCMAKVDNSVAIGDDVIILDNAKVLSKFANKSIYEVISNFKNKRAKIIVE